MQQRTMQIAVDADGERGRRASGLRPGVAATLALLGLTQAASADITFVNESIEGVYVTLEAFVPGDGAPLPLTPDLFVATGPNNSVTLPVVVEGSGAQLVVRVRTDLDSASSASAADFETRVYAVQDGSTVRLERDDSATWIGNYYLAAYDASGAEYANSDPWRNSRVRKVDFLGSADCQYWESETTLEGISDLTHDRMVDLLSPYGPPNYRGILMAGDLTQNSRTSEYDAYLDSFDGALQYVFDSVGNHDLHDTGIFGLSSPLNTIVELDRRNRVANRLAQSNALLSFGVYGLVYAPFYSWDWHDVHFVQLGMVPGMGDSQGGLTDFDGTPLPTYDSLQFLADDLAANVGDSGRPVILVHHYYMATEQQCPTCQWADVSQDERVAYWQTIEPYNVAAILSGHLHVAPGDDSSDWKFDWADPTGADPTRTIPNYLMGAARGSSASPSSVDYSGAYSTIEMNGVNQIRFRRFSSDPEQAATSKFDVIAFGDDVLHVSNTAGASRGFGTAFQPFPDPRDAEQALATRFPDTAGTEHAGAEEVQLEAGNYPGPMTLSSPARWSASGGVATLGAD